MADAKDDPRNVYADIIRLPHHQTGNRPHMSLYDRAAQFAPFAALVGYDEMVREEERLTDTERSLSEQEMSVLNRKLELIGSMVEERRHPEITVVFFAPDAHKSGGSYTAFTGVVRKIDVTEGKIFFC